MEALQSKSIIKINIRQRNLLDMTVRLCEEKEETNKLKLKPNITTKEAVRAELNG
jgi:hypothetical protein